MRTVFVDVDTQLDFVLPSGALYASGAERILHRIAALNSYAARTGASLISTTDAHSENDSEFATWPAHCIAGTLGQRKPESTLLARRAGLPSTPGALTADIAAAPQILLEKQHLDCFTNPNLLQLLSQLDAGRYVVYGVVTEYCVKFAALGLLALGKPVDVVENAVRCLDDAAARSTFDEVRARGGRIVTASAVTV